MAFLWTVNVETENNGVMWSGQLNSFRRPPSQSWYGKAESRNRAACRIAVPSTTSIKRTLDQIIITRQPTQEHGRPLLRRSLSFIPANLGSSSFILFLLAIISADVNKPFSYYCSRKIVRTLNSLSADSSLQRLLFLPSVNP